jgi:tellurium resistance protein TerD
MAVSLAKGGNVSLSKQSPGLTSVHVGLGWDLRQTDGEPFDLDASVFLLNAAGKVRNERDFVFYHNLTSACGCVVHQGDNRTGEGEGDDEVIVMDLAKISADVQKIVVTVSIDEANKRKQNFGLVNSAFIRVVNTVSGSELARFDLSEDASVATAMLFGEIYRHGAEWKFRARGEAVSGGLLAITRMHGITAT